MPFLYIIYFETALHNVQVHRQYNEFGDSSLWQRKGTTRWQQIAIH